MARKIKIQVFRGLEANLPTLNDGELGYATDSKKLFIGNASGGNTLLVNTSASGDMLKSVYDTNNNGKVDIAEVAESVTWGNVTGKPTSIVHNQGGDPSNWDTLVTAGVYRVGRANWTGITGSPTGAYPYGTLVVFVESSSVTQMYCPHNTQALLVRTKWNASDWCAWRELSIVGHTHAIADVSGLQTALDGKALSSHTHTKANITDFTHGHTISDVTNLQTTLDGKAPTHTHPYRPDTWTPVTQTIADNATGTSPSEDAVFHALAGKSDTSHGHGSIGFLDTRGTNHNGFDYQGVTIHLKSNSTDGLNDGGTYHGVLHLTQWSDISGGRSHQLGFTDNVNIYFRQWNGSWTAWKALSLSDHNHSGSYVDFGSMQDVGGRKSFTGGGNAWDASGSQGAVEVRGTGSSGADKPAFMCFHRPGVWATYFGLDTDNQFKYGGWSAGANKYTFWTSANQPKITSGTSAPASPNAGDIWVDTN